MHVSVILTFDYSELCINFSPYTGLKRKGEDRKSPLTKKSKTESPVPEGILPFYHLEFN